MTSPLVLRARRLLPIFAILALAGGLRVRGLGSDSLWGDEGLTVQLAHMDLYNLVKFDTWWEQIRPVHHLVIWVWIRLFGDSEFSVRLPSAIAGVASVGMLFVLMRRVMGWRAATCAALLLAVSPMHIA